MAGDVQKKWLALLRNSGILPIREGMKGKITFKDVAGVDEAKQELQEIVDFLKHPEKYRAIGARTPKGGSCAARAV